MGAKFFLGCAGNLVEFILVGCVGQFADSCVREVFDFGEFNVMNLANITTPLTILPIQNEL
jgi:hypothetical protein